ncbi:MAG: hypothetical protein ACRD2I_26450 [Vicinamibacterales bacterium]
MTNHVIVAMIAEDVKQVRCTTCDADHEFKHAKVPRQRRKSETPAALYAQVAASGPKRVTHEGGQAVDGAPRDASAAGSEEPPESSVPAIAAALETEEPPIVQAQHTDGDSEDEADSDGRDEEEGPVHRPLIRASLPRIDGAPPPTRQIPEFTIRQPGGRPSNRFRPRHQRGAGGPQFQGNRSHGGGNSAGSPRGMRSNGGRPPQGPGGAQMRRHGPGGRKRSK